MTTKRYQRTSRNRNCGGAKGCPCWREAWHRPRWHGVGSQPTDDIKLVQEAGRGPASVATQALGTPRWLGGDAGEVARQSFSGGGGGHRVPDRTVDAGARGQVDRAGVWGGVQHGQRLAHPARVRFLQPTSGGARDPARRSGDQAVAHQALAGAKKSPAAKGAPSSSSTKAD